MGRLRVFQGRRVSGFNLMLAKAAPFGAGSAVSSRRYSVSSSRRSAATAIALPSMKPEI